MANLIKSALIKQLSKFLKNVSANQINISTFKGEGEIKNIQLDENVLMELLELPTWLSITSARCNKVSIKIPWTKLKTVPIMIGLDKIEVEMEITENLREYKTSKDSKLFDKDLTGPYGFIDRCIDGIQLNIDSISVTIKSPKFNANLNMSNLLVYSTTPNWRLTSDIRNTRLKDLEKEEIIVFKEISWEICRLEAYNIDPTISTQQQQPTSIKLIMNPSKIQIALKKKLSDKSLLNSTFRILLNEIYWMANDTQLKAAIGTYNMIAKLIKKSSLQKRKYMAYQQQQQQQTPTKAQDTSKTSQQAQPNSDLGSKVFLQYDIKETSLHLNISILNIHLYADDNYSGNKLIDGGAMQVLFRDLCIDHYPYHKAGQSIKHWNRYNHIFSQREDWSKQLVEEFIFKLQNILNKSNLNDINKIKLKNEVSLLESCLIVTLQDLCVYKVSTNMSNKSATNFRQKRFASDVKQDDEAATLPNDLFKTNEYFIHQQLFNKRPFFSTNSAEFNLPSDTLFAHFFFSEFYFPDDCNYPVPCSQIYSHISPILINIDYLTLLWTNTLLLSLYNEKLFVDKNKETSINYNDDTKSASLNLHCDTHLELLMPKISLSIYATNLKENHFSNFKRQSGIEVGFARVTVSNRTNVSNNFDLKSVCSKVYDSAINLCNKQAKLNQMSTDKLNQTNLNHLAPCINELIKNENLAYFRIDLSSNTNPDLINTTNEAHNSKLGLFLKSLNRSSLYKNANKDLWCLNFESMWLDTFISNENASLNENSTLIQNVSFKLWLINVHDFYKPLETLNSNEHNTQQNGANANTINTESINHALDRLSKVIKIDDVDLESKKKRSNSLSTAPVLVKNQQDAYYLYCQTYSKINVIGELSDLTLKCNHSQVIFFLRLLDTVDIFMNQLKIDSEQTLKFTKTLTTMDKINKKQADLIYFSDQEDNSKKSIEIKTSVVNLSLVIKSVEVELSLNDHRKEINADFLSKKTMKQTESPTRKIDNTTTNTNNFNDSLNEESQFDVSNLNITIKDPMKDESLLPNDDDFIELTRKFDQEFITGYLRYVYGFSSENPNLRLSFSSVALIDEARMTNPNSNDLLNLARQVNKLPTNLNQAVSVSFSAASSTISAKKNSTIAFFNKPAFNNIKSNIKQQFNSSQSSGSDYIDTDLLSDDNDSYSNIIGLDQDDTSSLASFATDLSSSYIQQQTSNSPNKTSPNEQPSMSLSSSNSSIAANSKITSISANLTEQTQELTTNTTINKEMTPIEELNKSFTDYQSQTIQTTIFVKLKITNINTYVQIDDNSDMYTVVKLDQVKLRNMPSKFKDENSDLLIRFKKVENSLDCKEGLIEVMLDGFCFEIDIPTLTGLIDLIDDDDVGVLIKAQVMPANILVKNCEFNLNNQINETNEWLKDEKTVRLNINNLLINRLATNEIVIGEANLNQKNKKVNHDVALNDLEFIETNSPKPNQLASLVYLLRKSKEDYHSLTTRFEIEKMKCLEVEKENIKIKFENEELKKGFNEVEKKTGDEETVTLKEQLEFERKQFESLLQSFQDENEQLRNKLKKTDEMVALLNLERDCLMKKLNEQLKSAKK